MIKLLIFIIFLGILVYVGIGIPIIAAILSMVGIVVLPFLLAFVFWLLFWYYSNKLRLSLVFGIIGFIVGVLLDYFILVPMCLSSLKTVGKFFVDLLKNL